MSQRYHGCDDGLAVATRYFVISPLGTLPSSIVNVAQTRVQRTPTLPHASCAHHDRRGFVATKQSWSPPSRFTLPFADKRTDSFQPPALRTCYAQAALSICRCCSYIGRAVRLGTAPASHHTDLLHSGQTVRLLRAALHACHCGPPVYLRFRLAFTTQAISPPAHTLRAHAATPHLPGHFW